MVTKSKKAKVPTMESPTTTPTVENNAVTEVLQESTAPVVSNGTPLSECTSLETMRKAVAQLSAVLEDLKKTEALSQGDNWYFRKATTIVNARANLSVKTVDGVVYMVPDA